MSTETVVSFISLGCVKNLVDSEKMLGQLAEAGCALTNDESEADVIVVNTCGFLEASRTEAVEIIEEAVERKRSGRCRRVVVAGCLVQRDRTRLLETVEGIDALVGVNNRDDIVRAVIGDNGHSELPADVFLGDYYPHVQLDSVRLRLTPRHYAYLRISEGCNQKCTFCTIPSIRGPMHSKPPEVLVREAQELTSDGAVELMLIGQDTTSYGQDIGDGSNLGSLLRRLGAIDGVEWIRLMYAYPSVLTDAMIDAMAESEHVLNYLDIPLQHINDRVLKSMHRNINRRQTEALLDRVRQRMPDVTIRTTMIVGFPGETEAEFAELVDFVRTLRFDALGAFTYSLEPDTPAGRMKNQISENVKQDRLDALMMAQQEVAFHSADDMIGKRLRVLIDEPAVDGFAVGRHSGQAPMVDSVTHVCQADAAPGTFFDVQCVERRGYDLIAERTAVALPILT